MKVEGVSNKGLVKSNNEDCYVIDDKYLFDTSFCYEKANLIFVCDGVSESKLGAYASKFVCDDISKNYNNIISFTDEQLRKYFEGINDSLVKNCDKAYTTIAGIITTKNFLKVVNVGDSKVYRFREEILKQLTTDDTYYEYLKRINDQKYEEYKNSHIITNCLGQNKFDKNSIHINNIEFGVMEKDIFLICSDGVSDMVSRDYIVSVLLSKKSLKSKIKALEKEVLKNGAIDNYTMILLEV